MRDLYGDLLYMRRRLVDRLEEAGAMQIPVRRAGWQADEQKLPD